MISVYIIHNLLSSRALNIKFSQKEELVWASQNKFPKNPSGGGSESPETQVNKPIGRDKFLLRLHRYAQKCEHNVSVKNIIKYKNCAENGYNRPFAKSKMYKYENIKNYGPEKFRRIIGFFLKNIVIAENASLLDLI